MFFIIKESLVTRHVKTSTKIWEQVWMAHYWFLYTFYTTKIWKRKQFIFFYLKKYTPRFDHICISWQIQRIVVSVLHVLVQVTVRTSVQRNTSTIIPACWKHTSCNENCTLPQWLYYKSQSTNTYTTGRLHKDKLFCTNTAESPKLVQGNRHKDKRNSTQTFQAPHTYTKGAWTKQPEPKEFLALNWRITMCTEKLTYCHTSCNKNINTHAHTHAQNKHKDLNTKSNITAIKHLNYAVLPKETTLPANLNYHLQQGISSQQQVLQKHMTLSDIQT